MRELPEASRSRMLEKTEVYREVEGAETLPPYVDSRQEENGAKISGRLYMQESRVLGEEWREDFQAPVTFYSYGADEYELGGIKISGGRYPGFSFGRTGASFRRNGAFVRGLPYHIYGLGWGKLYG